MGPDLDRIYGQHRVDPSADRSRPSSDIHSALAGSTHANEYDALRRTDWSRAIIRANLRIHAAKDCACFSKTHWNVIFLLNSICLPTWTCGISCASIEGMVRSWIACASHLQSTSSKLPWNVVDPWCIPRLQVGKHWWTLHLNRRPTSPVSMIDSQSTSARCGSRRLPLSGS